MTHSDSTTDWNQQAFEATDRRGARQRSAGSADRVHDVLHLAAEPEHAAGLHALVHEHGRHTDALHAHADGLLVTCPEGDGPGLRARLEEQAGRRGLPVRIQHGTFPAGVQLTEVAGSLGGA